MRIGIMGGTFNPIHHGHLILSEYIRLEARLDKIIFIPTGTPPHKSPSEILEGDTRIKMVELAIEDNSYFSISDIEVKRNKTTYTIDTIREIKDIYKDAQIYMIIGADTLLSLHTWKDFDDLFSLIGFIVADRFVQNGQEVLKEIDRLKGLYDGDVASIDSPIIDISSTFIRGRIRENLSIKYLLPKKVEDYILENKLYK